MRTLVTWASKHGSTAKISYAVGRVLRERGVTVVLAPIDSADMDEDYDAYVIGSGYMPGTG